MPKVGETVADDPRAGWKKAEVTVNTPDLSYTVKGLVRGGLLVHKRPARFVAPGSKLLYAVVHVGSSLRGSLVETEEDGLRVANELIRRKGMFLRSAGSDVEKVKAEFAKDGPLREWGRAVNKAGRYLPFPGGES